MFNMERLERVLVIFLIVTLLIGVGVMAYKKSSPGGDLRITKPDITLDPKEGTLRQKEKININTAEIDDLMRLSGVGRVLAERIITYRDTNGRFWSIDDVRKVKGIGASLFEKIKDDIFIE